MRKALHGNTEFKANLTKRRQQTVPTKVNPPCSQTGRLLGHSRKVAPAVDENDQATVPPTTQSAIRPNIGRMAPHYQYRRRRRRPLRFGVNLLVVATYEKRQRATDPCPRPMDGTSRNTVQRKAEATTQKEGKGAERTFLPLTGHSIWEMFRGFAEAGHAKFRAKLGDTIAKGRTRIVAPRAP